MAAGKYFPGVDLLRFIAALSVVAYHYTFSGPLRGWLPANFSSLTPFSQYGYLGVDLFFIISGFVIAVTAEKHNAAGFAFARFKRLYPAYLVAVIATFAIMHLFPSSFLPAPSLATLSANIFFLQGPLRLEHIDGAYWSLLVEVQFYAAITLLLALKKRHWLLPACALWLTLSTLHNQAIFSIPHLSTGLLASMWCAYFTAGVALHHLVFNRKPWLALGVWVASLLSAIPTAWQHAAESPFLAITTYTPTTHGLLICALFFLMYTAAISNTPSKNNPLSKAALTLGALTYPLYLLHENNGAILATQLSTWLSPNQAVLCVFIAILLVSHLIATIAEPRARQALNQLTQRLPQRIKLR